MRFVHGVPLSARRPRQCGRASAVIVLNGLASEGVAAAVDPVFSPYPYWTQVNRVVSASYLPRIGGLPAIFICGDRTWTRA